MEFEFQLTREEFKGFYKSYYNLPRKIFFVILLSVLFSLLITFENFTWWKFSLSLVVLLTILTLVYKLIPQIISKRKITKDKEFVSGNLLKTNVYVFHEGLHVEIMDKSRLIKWEELHSTFINDKFICIIISDLSFLIIPKRIFSSVNERNNFQEIIHYEKLKNNPAIIDRRSKILFHLRWALPVFVFLFMLFKGCIVYEIHNINEHDLSKDEIKLKKAAAIKECKNLFLKEVRDSIQTSYLYFSYQFNLTKSQHPFCELGYKNYGITIHKVTIPPTSSLRNIIAIEQREDNPGIENFGGGYGDGNYSPEFRYSAEHDSLANQIFISYDGSLLYSGSIGDSIINYNLATPSVSFRYEPNGNVNFSLSMSNDNFIYKSRKKLIYTNISIYKKQNEAFIIVMYSKNRRPIDNYSLARLLVRNPAGK